MSGTPPLRLCARRVVLPLALLSGGGVTGCAEPPQNTSPYAQGGPGQPPGPPPGGPSSGAERAADGAPGPAPVEGGGGPGDGGQGAGCKLTPDWAANNPGGEVATAGGTAAGTGTGPLLVDVIDTGSGKIVWGVECSGAGAFTVTMPADLGDVWLAAYIDLTGDGPTPDDPQGRSNGEFDAKSPPTDLSLTLAVGSPLTGIVSGGGPGPGPGSSTEEGPAAGDSGVSCRAAGDWANKPKTASGGTISGSLVLPEGAKGTVLIDLVDVGSNEVVFGVECPAGQVFSLAPPTGLSPVWLAAFLDTNSDGPSPDDPQGRTKGTLQPDAGATDLSLTLVAGKPLPAVIYAKVPEPGTEPGGPPPGSETPDPGGPPPGEATPEGQRPPTDAPPPEAP